MKYRGYIVVRCPRCSKWTYAKSTQKTRLCSRCEKRFKINDLEVIYAESHQHAHILVKHKNEQEMKKDLKS
ncbi:MAG: DUF1922 domain-containing protein [Asgard group archaeon]|nr:DUF1922 domain-containing protein [Asgard group archaeon]